MRILINEKLSAHKFKTPEGYLICQDAVLARTGPQTYRKNEIFLDSDSDEEIQVDRKPEQVFAPETLASFENKPITVEHPEEDVTVDNYKDYAVGFVRDVRQGKDGDNDVILGNLVITDKDTIDEILDGQHTELSCGYDCDITDDDNPQQIRIRGNHLALCERGRAGIARIVDSVNDEEDMSATITVQCYIINKDKILIQDRVGPAWKGLAVPGGHLKPNENILQACIREVKEETGLTVSNLKLFGVNQYVCPKDGNGIAMLYKTTSFVGNLQSSSEGKMQWMKIEDVLNSNNCAEGFKELLEKCINSTTINGITDAKKNDEKIKDSQPQKIFKVNETFIVAKDRYDAIRIYKKNEQRNDR